MSKELFWHYEQELRFIRHLGKEFAEQYPERAGRLGLHAPGEAADPHVERLIEAFALLTGRIQSKLDDEFPELTDALLGVLYPHYQAPIPSMGVVQLDIDASRGDFSRGFSVPRYSKVTTSHAVEYDEGKSYPCQYRTCFPVTLWPLTLTSARLSQPPFPADLHPPDKTVAVLRLHLASQGPKVADFDPQSFKRLRFYLYGDNTLLGPLYETLFNKVLQVRFDPADREGAAAAKSFTLDPARCLFPVGFEQNEGMFPYPRQSFLGYRLLTEFFAFPAKFFFFDLGGMDECRQRGFGTRLDVTLFLKDLKQEDFGPLSAVSKDTFRLGCTPIVNLFDHKADPISLTAAQFEYPVIADGNHRQALEVYSVDEVSHTDPTTGKRTDYQPFYSFRHGQGLRQQKAFWFASRRPALKGSEGTEAYLNLVDLDFDPRLPQAPVLHLQTTCMNRAGLCTRLKLAGEQLDLDLPGIPLPRIKCVHPVSVPVPPPMRRKGYWPVISHLSLNHLSLTDDKEGADALREILRLYDTSGEHAELIEAIHSVSTRRVVRRLADAPSSGVARGVEVTVTWNRDKCLSTGVFVYASVLERFLALYSSINSFTLLVGKTLQEREAFKTWPPRSGDQIPL